MTPPSPAGSDAHVERYEELRVYVFEGGSWSPRLGLAVLQREGVVAWMEAWSACREPAASSVGSRGEGLPDEKCSAVVDVLANMALSYLEARSA